MTSTSFNVGINGVDKTSSRVLRSPGGGHSDIFGIRDNKNETMTPSKKKNYPQSTISSCFTMVENSTEPKAKENGTDENTAPTKASNKSETDQGKISPNKRVRVPPGGFSSGLW